MFFFFMEACLMGSKVSALRSLEFTSNYFVIAITQKYVYWLLIVLCVAHASVMKNAYNLITLQY